MTPHDLLTPDEVAAAILELTTEQMIALDNYAGDDPRRVSAWIRKNVPRQTIDRNLAKGRERINEIAGRNLAQHFRSQWTRRRPQ